MISRFMPIKRFVSLPTRIFLAMLFLLTITVVTVSTTWYSNASAALENDTREYLGSGVRTVNAQLDSFLKVTNSTAKNIAYGYPKYKHVIMYGPYGNLGFYMQQVREIERDILQNIFVFSDYLNGVAIVSRSGYMFKAGYLNTTINDVDKPFITKAMEGEVRAVYAKTNRPSSPNLNSETLTFCVPIRFDEEVAGVVVMDLSFRSILAFYKMQNERIASLKDDMRLVSLLPDGEILYDSFAYPDTDATGHDAQASWPYGDAAKVEIFRDGFPGIQQCVDAIDLVDGEGMVRIGGRPYLLVSETASFTGITTFGVVPRNALRSRVNDAFGWSLGIVGSIFLLALAVTYLVTRETTRGLRSLNRTMEQVGQDGIGARADIHGEDEIASLARNFNAMLARVEDLMARVSQEEAALHRMELDVFRSQINPHFLYNTLLTIRHLAKLRGIRSIDEVAMSLSKMLRGALDKDAEFTPLSSELEMLRNYMSIQQYRYPEPVDLETAFAEDMMTVRLPRMILQPLVENALFHGYGAGKRSGAIRLSGRWESDDLLVTVRDEGEGMTGEQIQSLLHLEEPDGQDPDGRVHVGIKNVHRRLQLYYGQGYGLAIRSAKGSHTEVVVRIPARMGPAEKEALRRLEPTGRDKLEHAKPAEGNQLKPAEGNQLKPAEGNQLEPAEGNQLEPAEGNQSKLAEGEQSI